jgi:hypothetical protein
MAVPWQGSLFLNTIPPYIGLTLGFLPFLATFVHESASSAIVSRSVRDSPLAYAPRSRCAGHCKREARAFFHSFYPAEFVRNGMPSSGIRFRSPLGGPSSRCSRQRGEEDVSSPRTRLVSEFVCRPLLALRQPLGKRAGQFSERTSYLEIHFPPHLTPATGEKKRPVRRAHLLSRNSLCRPLLTLR